MRERAHERRQNRCNRVPAVNKSLEVGSALVKLVSGMESKRSTNTCAPRDRNIKMLKHFEKNAEDDHTQQPSAH